MGYAPKEVVMQKNLDKSLSNSVYMKNLNDEISYNLANKVNKSDIANYQTKGDYITNSKVSELYQPKGEYVTTSDLHNYIPLSDMVGYVKQGDLAKNNDEIYLDLAKKADKSDISKLQPKGDYIKYMVVKYKDEDVRYQLIDKITINNWYNNIKFIHDNLSISTPFPDPFGNTIKGNPRVLKYTDNTPILKYSDMLGSYTDPYVYIDTDFMSMAEHLPGMMIHEYIRTTQKGIIESKPSVADVKKLISDTIASNPSGSIDADDIVGIIKGVHPTNPELRRVCTHTIRVTLHILFNINTFENILDFDKQLIKLYDQLNSDEHLRIDDINEFYKQFPNVILNEDLTPFTELGSSDFGKTSELYYINITEAKNMITYYLNSSHSVSSTLIGIVFESMGNFNPMDSIDGMFNMIHNIISNIMITNSIEKIGEITKRIDKQDDIISEIKRSLK